MGKHKACIKLYTIIEVSTDDVYAWTEDKKLAYEFIEMRKTGYFKLQTTKIFDEEYGKWELSVFKNEFAGKQIMMNVLGRNAHDTIWFPTTYFENQALEKECDDIYNKMLEISTQLCSYPLTDSLQETLKMLSRESCRDGGKNVSFDAFYVFMKLFGHTVL